MLDLFCGAGGASEGYARAARALGVELEIVGVDHRPQPSYPFEFVLADALSVPLDGYSFIHASPPCKRYTVARRVHVVNRPTLFDPHDDLIPATRERLRASGARYAIENVPGSPLEDPVVLCGSMFGLRVRRHRLFEVNFELEQPPCRHAEQGDVVGVYGDGGAWTRVQKGGGGTKVVGAEAARALGIGWTTRQSELAQAIPPAYTEHVGIAALERELVRSAR